LAALTGVNAVNGQQKQQRSVMATVSFLPLAPLCHH